MKRITTTSDDIGKRLDKYLTEHLPDTTRSQIKKMIKNNLILINGAQPSVHQFLKSDDVIKIKQAEAPEIPKTANIPILSKGDGYIVIDKPAGILTHQGNNKTATAKVTDWILKRFPKISEIGEPDRPGIVHRLDKETSGVMVIASTLEMYENLKRQFHDRKTKKTYIALVHGNLPELSGTINKPIGRSTTGGHMAARTKALSDRDREAITEYEVIKRYKNYDLVKARPLTGRTHQIRVHFKSMGNPIVGDKLYLIRRQKKIVELGRVFLHSHQLEFTDLEGNRQTISSELPEQLQEFLNEIT